METSEVIKNSVIEHYKKMDKAIRTQGLDWDTVLYECRMAGCDIDKSEVNAWKRGEVGRIEICYGYVASVLGVDSF